MEGGELTEFLPLTGFNFLSLDNSRSTVLTKTVRVLLVSPGMKQLILLLTKYNMHLIVSVAPVDMK